MSSIRSQTRSSSVRGPMHTVRDSALFSRLRQRGSDIAIQLRSEYKESGAAKKEVALFFGYIVAGWNDAATGAVLPSIQEHYNIGFIVVSMIFITNLAGWLIAAGLCPYLTDRLGFGKALALFASIVIIPYAVFIPLPPYPLFALVFVLSGLSVGSQDSLANTWMSNRPRPDLRLGILHFIYGLGAFLAPLCAAPFNEADYSFSYFYAIPLGLAVLNFAGVSAAWKWQREEDDHVAPTSAAVDVREEQGHELATLSHTPHPGHTATTPDVEDKFTPGTPGSEDVRMGGETSAGVLSPNAQPTVAAAAAATASTQAMTTKEKYRAVLRNPTVHVIAFFALFYVGTEVAIGGWTSSFLLAKENTSLKISDANALISGFWAGIALGRVLLIPVTSLIGAQLAVFVYLALAIALQVVVWLAPHIIADGISLAFMGLFLGPIFPIMIEIASKKIRPRALHTAAISYIVSFGSAGSALFPFIVGLIAQSKGIRVLAPILVALLAVQAGMWALLGDPRRSKAEVEDRVD